MTFFRFASATVLSVLSLSSCSSDDDDTPINQDPDGVVVFNASFDGDADGWVARFADYPAGDEDFHQLVSGISTLPEPLQDRSGFNVSGNNHSDDLFMYITRQFSGLDPARRYSIDFSVSFATNVPMGCAGIGGAPGESVSVKAGASTIEPTSSADGDGTLRMDIDIGNQTVGGSDAVVIGDVTSSRQCEDPDFPWEIKTLDNAATPFTAFADDDGALWVLFGTDSGFEGITSIYFTEATDTATPL